MIIRNNGTRQFGYFNESEMPISQMDSEDHTEFNLDPKILLVANYVRLKNGRIDNGKPARSRKKNSTIQGAAINSQHILESGMVRAMDLHPLDVSVNDLKAWVMFNLRTLRLMGVRGIGFYSWGVHLDTRKQGKMSAWGMSEKDKATIKGTKNLLGF